MSDKKPCKRPECLALTKSYAKAFAILAKMTRRRLTAETGRAPTRKKLLHVLDAPAQLNPCMGECRGVPSE